MSACSHALYLALTADLQRYLPNKNEVFCPTNLSSITFEPVQNLKGRASASLLTSIFKKFQDSISDDADTRALDLFIRMNNHCREFTFDLWALPEEVLQSLTWAKTYIDRWVSSGPESIFEPSSWLDYCDFGPGASVLAAGTSFYHKIGSSKLSCTDNLLYSIYIESLRGSSSWIRAEKFRRDSFGRPEVVSGSKLCFVPKTSKISRTICTEPSLNMFVQKGLSGRLESVLKKSIGFDLKDQQFRNKRLARIGSKTGTLSTIDLSSASDTISRTIVSYLFPAHIVAWLDLCRSPRTTLPDGSVVELHMISSMGNAYTFPLQTMIFSAIALGVYKVCGIDFRKPHNDFDGNLGVFGDDIIVRSECYDLMIRCLNACGFFVNESKSYNAGLFRESCGGDYFDGHNIRGVYCKTLRSTHSIYSLINRLQDWSANHQIPLYNAISYLTGCVRFLPVPPWESDIAGIKVPVALANVKRNSNGSFVYRRLQARAISLDMTNLECGFKSRKFRVVYNPDALLISAIGGRLRNGSLNIRLDVVRPNYRFGVAPCWDYIDLEHSRLENVGFSVWKQMSLTNFSDRFVTETCP